MTGEAGIIISKPRSYCQWFGFTINSPKMPHMYELIITNWYYPLQLLICLENKTAAKEPTQSFPAPTYYFIEFLFSISWCAASTVSEWPTGACIWKIFHHLKFDYAPFLIECETLPVTSVPPPPTVSWHHSAHHVEMDKSMGPAYISII